MTSTIGAHTDPVTSEVIRNAMTATANEMNNIIVRTAYNPLLFDSKDFGIAVLSATGELWAEDSGLSCFLGCIHELVKSGIDKRGPDGFADGDILIVNDPFLTGTHISDTSVYMPVMHQGVLVAFIAVTAHWADIGGRNPGGWDMTATELFQEGMCFTHQRLVRAGEPVQDLFDFIESNVRFPDIVRGDLESQISACRTGRDRIAALCERYGRDTVVESMGHVLASTQEETARRIEALPDGDYSRSIRMDYDGIDPQARPRISVTMSVRGSRITASFDGTSPAADSSCNLAPIGTRSSVLVAIKSLLAPTEPTNAGHFANVDFDLPEGTVLSPTRPRATDSYGYAAVAVIELTQLALAELFPETSRAGAYQLFGVYFMRTDPASGYPFIMIEPNPGGHGGHSKGDGASLVFMMDGDTQTLPVEVMENRYPVRCLRYEFAEETAGAGASRGGYGLIREYEVLEPGTVLKYMNEGTKEVTAQGVNGGEDGAPSRVVVRPDTDHEVVLFDRGDYSGELKPGDIVRSISGGGGGWGAPR